MSNAPYIDTKIKQVIASMVYVQNRGHSLFTTKRASAYKSKKGHALYLNINKNKPQCLSSSRIIIGLETCHQYLKTVFNRRNEHNGPVESFFT